MKSKSSLFIIIIVAFLVIVGLIYFFTRKNNSPITTAAPVGGLVSTNTGKNTGNTVATTGNTTGDQVVSLLRNLSIIQLNDTIFQNPSFVMLQDISITLPPVTNQGRRNPFGVVGSDAIVQEIIENTSSSSKTSPVTTRSGTAQ